MRRLLPRLRPWHIVLLSVAASGAAGAWVAAEARAAAGDLAGARRLRLTVPALLLLLMAVSLPPLRWGWIASMLFALNLSLGLLLRKSPWPGGIPPLAPSAPPVERRRHRVGSLAEIFWGAASGALASGLGGAAAGLAYLLAVDLLVSTWLPSLTDKLSMVGSVLWLILQFFLCGAVVGGIIGARRPRLSSREISAALGGIFLAYFVLQSASTAVIDIPAFQQARLLESGGAALGCARAALWFFQMAAAVLAGLAGAALAGPAEAPRPRFRVAAAALCALVLAPWTMGLYAGRLGYDAILAGILLERGGSLDAAKSLYILGLKQHPDDRAGSYLQFRLGMVYHRLGRDEDSKAMLKRLVARQGNSRKLVELAEQYLQAWERSVPGARRVILPGIEAATEFKAGYCMPNSLSLVLRHWGVKDSAKEIGGRITAMDGGTTLQDSVWYVQSRGLRHFLSPLSTVEDLKGYVNEGIPVLIYIPQHVLAVIGYDEAWDTLVTYDVAQEEIWIDQPISQLVPQWKSEKAVVSVVLSKELFACLPQERRHRLETSTAAHLHYILHHGYHQTRTLRDEDLALAHLEASMGKDPSQFYVMAHLFGRSEWGESVRSRVAKRFPLKKLALSGFSFASKDFYGGEALRELSISAADLGLRRELKGFLYGLRGDGTLERQSELAAMLGRLQMEDGNAREAAVILGKSRGGAYRQWALAAAQEKSGDRSAAIETYRAILQGNAYRQYYEDEEDGAPPEWFGSMASETALSPKDPALRRKALEKFLSLRAPGAAEQPDVDALGRYCDDFPWDVDAQARYTGFLSERLKADGLSPVIRQKLRTRLDRAARLAGYYEPGGEAASRALVLKKAVEARASR